MSDTVDLFTDPVTYEIMMDPVVCSDGYTYDRATARQLSKSPFTREPLRILVENVALRGDIFEAHPDVAKAYHDAKAVAAAPQVPKLAEPRVTGHVVGAQQPQATTRCYPPCIDGQMPTTRNVAGVLADGRYQGHATLKWPSGDEYDGNFERGEASGHGRFTVGRRQFDWLTSIFDAHDHTAKGVYDGAFSHGRPHGEGTYRWDSGETLQGTWEGGYPIKGLMTWPNGDKFDGEFIEHVPRVGRYTWRNGDWLHADISRIDVLRSAHSPNHRAAEGHFSGCDYRGWLDCKRIAYKGHLFVHHVNIPQRQSMPPAINNHVYLVQREPVDRRAN